MFPLLLAFKYLHYSFTALNISQTLTVQQSNLQSKQQLLKGSRSEEVSCNFSVWYWQFSEHSQTRGCPREGAWQQEAKPEAPHVCDPGLTDRLHLPKGDFQTGTSVSSLQGFFRRTSCWTSKNTEVLHFTLQSHFCFSPTKIGADLKNFQVSFDTPWLPASLLRSWKLSSGSGLQLPVRDLSNKTLTQTAPSWAVPWVIQHQVTLC